MSGRRAVLVEAAICTALALGTLIAVQLDAPRAARLVPGLLVSLVVPGWLLFGALTRRRPQSVVDVSLGVLGSIGILIAVGIAVDAADLGLRPASWAGGLLVVVVGLAAAAVVRREEPVTPAATSQQVQPDGGVGLRAGRIVLPAVICLSLIGAGWLVTVNSQRSALSEQGLTELWLSGEGRRQVVHVWNKEGTPMDYRVVVSVVGRPQRPQTFHLADGEKWSSEVDVPPRSRRASGSPTTIAVALYRGTETSVYREVHRNRAGG